ncbi:hypothetical protein ACVMB3_005292 [Sinorhizobium meliloti]
MSTSVIAPQSATIVPEASRPEFLPTLFGRSLLIVAENAVYSLMERLSPLDYGGGFWTFYEHEGKPLFLAPQSKSRFRITGEITGFQGGGVRRGRRHHRHTVRLLPSLLPVSVRTSL